MSDVRVSVGTAWLDIDVTPESLAKVRTKIKDLFKDFNKSGTDINKLKLDVDSSWLHKRIKKALKDQGSFQLQIEPTVRVRVDEAVFQQSINDAISKMKTPTVKVKAEVTGQSQGGAKGGGGGSRSTPKADELTKAVGAQIALNKATTEYYNLLVKYGDESKVVKAAEERKAARQQEYDQQKALAASALAITETDVQAKVDANDKVIKSNNRLWESEARKEASEAKLAASTANLKQKAIELYRELERAGASKEVLGELRDLINKIDNTDLKKSRSGISQLSAELRKFEANIEQTGDKTETMGRKINRVFSEKLGYGIMAAGAMAARRAIRQLYTNVVELDTAMTELRKVTDATDETYRKFLDNAGDEAREIGVSMTDLVTATADFARLGYDITDASYLAQVATVYKHVGDGISNISDASQSIISTMRAFDIEASDSMLVVDKFNEVANTTPITAAGIGEALQRSASALDVANNTLDESIALIVAANSVVQDPQKVGTSLKTISMYLRAAKTEAEEAGESTDGMAESVSKLRGELLALTGNRLDIQLDPNTYKSTYQILKELAEIWNTGVLSDISKANILERLSGKRNANVTASILENFSLAEQTLETSLNSAGSAMAENEKYLDSINGRIEQLTASWQKLSQAVLNNNLIKALVSGATAIVDALNGLNEKSDGLGAIFVDSTVGVLGLVAGISAAKDMMLKFGETFKVVKKSGEDFSKLEKAFLNIKPAADGGVVGILSFGKALLAATVAAAALALIVWGVTKAVEAYKKSHPTTDDLTASAKETKKELDDVTTELKNISTQIDEIKGKGELSLTDEQELQRLYSENNELTRRQQILDALYKQQMRDVAKSSYKDLVGVNTIKFEGTEEGEDGSNVPIFSSHSKLGDFEDNIQKLVQLNHDYADAQKAVADAQEAYGITSTQYTEASEKMSNLNEDIQKLTGTIRDDYSEISVLADNLIPDDPEQLAALERFKDAELLLNRALGNQIDLLQTSQYLLGKQANSGAKSFLDTMHDRGALSGETLLNSYRADVDEEGSLYRFITELENLTGVTIDKTAEGFQKLIDMLYGVEDAAEEAGEAIAEGFTDELRKALDSLDEKYNTLQTAQKELRESQTLTQSTIKSFAEDDRMKDTIALYKMGFITAKDVYAKFEALYQEDKQNFERENALKIAFTEEYYNKHIGGSEKWVNLLGKAYTSDFNNWKRLEQSKLDLDNRLITTLGDNWKEYYKTYAAATEAMTTLSLPQLSEAEFAAKGGAFVPGVNGKITSYSRYAYEIEKYNASMGSQNYVSQAAMRAARQLDAIEQNLTINLPDYTTSTGTGEDNDPNKDAAEKEIKKLKHQLEMQKITVKEYYDGLQTIEDKYYSDKEKYEEERWALDEEIFNGRLSILDDFLNNQELLLEKAAGNEDFNTQINIYETNLDKINELLKWALDQGYGENSEFVQKIRKLYKDNNDKLVELLMDPWKKYKQYLDDFELWDDVDYTQGDYMKAWRADIERLYREGRLTLVEYKDLMNDVGKDLYSYYKNGITDVINLTMEMIEQETKDLTDALDDQIDKFKEIVDLKKKSLQETKDEIDHQEELSDAVNEIAKLESKISQLSLDDSRSATAKRAELEEQLAQKRRDLARSQRDYAIEQTINALDESEEKFTEEKEKEKEAAEDSIDTWVKRYQKAIDMLNSDWNGTFQKLKNYMAEYTTSIDGEDSLVSAWKAATEAVRDYGDSLDDIMSAYYNIGKIGLAPETEPAVGNSTSYDEVYEIRRQMKANSAAWTPETGAALAQKNRELAESLRKFGINPVRDERYGSKTSGVWFANTIGGQTLDDWFDSYLASASAANVATSSSGYNVALKNIANATGSAMNLVGNLLPNGAIPMANNTFNVNNYINITGVEGVDEASATLIGNTVADIGNKNLLKTMYVRGMR